MSIKDDSSCKHSIIKKIRYAYLAFMLIFIAGGTTAVLVSHYQELTLAKVVDQAIPAVQHLKEIKSGIFQMRSASLNYILALNTKEELSESSEYTVAHTALLNSIRDYRAVETQAKESKIEAAHLVIITEIEALIEQLDKLFVQVIIGSWSGIDQRQLFTEADVLAIEITTRINQLIRSEEHQLNSAVQQGHSLSLNFTISAALVLLLSLILMNLTYRRIRKGISQPIQTIEETIRKQMAGDLTARNHLQGEESELGMLANRLDSVSDTIISLNQQLEQKVTERTKALRQQQIELERMHLAVDLHAIISIADTAGNITYVNDQFCELSGYSREELLGKNYRILKSGLHPPEFYEEFFATITQGNVWEGEIRNLKKDGKSFYWVRETVVPFLDEQGKPIKYISIQTDLTAIKQSSEALLSAKESAEQATEAKSDFLASMSHELRTPLAAIIGNCELLMELEDAPEHHELIETIEVAGRSQLALVNDILDMSKIESGKFSVNQSPYDLDLFLHEMRQIFSTRAQDAGLAFEIHSSITTEHQLIGDRQRIGQILINLLGNAVKFTEHGSVTLNVFRASERLHFVVEDSGIGMSPEVLSRLFQRFEQADNSISSRFGGSGLGLYISQNLVSLMGGEIQVESAVGKGSEFHVILPYKESELPIFSNLNSDSKAERKVFYKGDVLIAEDTPVLQKMEQRMLESMGITVTLANNGIEAVNIASQQPFDLILMDMQMPLMDGIEATRVLTKQGTTTPIVALTANVMQKHRNAFHKAGCSGFLSKPLERPELNQVLKQYLPIVQHQERSGIDRRQGDERRATEETISNEPSASKTALSQALSELAVDDSFLEMFNEFTTENHQNLSSALQQQDWRQVDSISHSIKGVGSTFGFPELSELGATICTAIDQGEQPVATVETLLSKLKQASMV